MANNDRISKSGWQAALLVVVVANLLFLCGCVTSPTRVPEPKVQQMVISPSAPSAAPTSTPQPAVTPGHRTRPLETSPRPTQPSRATQPPAMQTAVAPITSPTPVATQPSDKDHYWLARPIRAEDTDSIEPYYPYGSKGDGTYPIHHGVEFENPMGTPVLAAAAGTVVVAGDDKRETYGAYADYYGLLVVERLDEPLDGKPVYVLYGHLSEINVVVGQRVEEGEIIGAVGMTGVAQGPHLHFEVRYGQNSFAATVNPELWLRPHDGCGILAGVVLSPNGEPIPEVWVAVVKPDTLEESVREVTTYPAREVNSDPRWRENWCAGDLEAGEYEVQAYLSERVLAARTVVTAGMTTWVTLK